MFATAIVIGDATHAWAKFNRWLRLLDPAKAHCPHICERRFSWGWVGWAGRSFRMVHNQPDEPLLIVHGAVLEADIGLSPSTPRDWTGLAERLARSTGQFVFLLAREDDQTPVIAGLDNMGMRALFFGENKTATVIANHSSLGGLLLGCTEPNLAYIRDLVSKDAVVPDSTLVRHIRRVPRGYYLVHQSGKTTLTPNGFRDLHLLTADREAALAGLRKSARSLQQDGQPYLLGLTGGLDARLALSLLMAEKVSFEAASHGMPCHDGELATKLARIVGVPHWSVSRRPGSLLEGMLKCLDLLPWAEGCQFVSSLNHPHLVHDIAAARGMVHLGGLGGEPARSYWDPADAEFATAHELLDARFFTKRQTDLYPDNQLVEESRAAWHALAELPGQVDPFVFAQIAFFDARLRGTLVLRANGSWYDYAWLLAHPIFYAYSLRLPRTARQQAQVFHDFINTLAPALGVVPLNAGNAGDFRKRGVAAGMTRIKETIKRTLVTHHIQARILKTRRYLANAQVKPATVVTRAFLADREARDWIVEVFGPRALACFDTGSSTFAHPAEKAASLYLICLILRALSSQNAPNPLWELPWLRQALNTFEGGPA